MQPISASFPPSASGRSPDRSRRPVARGFTLLELLVVMALLALATGVTAPRLMRWAEAAEERAALDALALAIEQLPEQAFFEGRSLHLDQALDPAGQRGRAWTLRASTPVHYSSLGYTGGGEIAVMEGSRAVAVWRITAPNGRLDRQPEGRP